MLPLEISFMLENVVRAFERTKYHVNNFQRGLCEDLFVKKSFSGNFSHILLGNIDFGANLVEISGVLPFEISVSVYISS